jgi:hypothetical protein
MERGDGFRLQLLTVTALIRLRNAIFRRINWMQTMIIHSQKRAYCANQISPDQAKRTRTSPTPAAMAHQPNIARGGALRV